MCNCQSYNKPEWGGATPERILNHNQYFPDSSRDTICVDECIADTILRLWAAGVKTAACCCGHNMQSPIGNGHPHVILEDPSQAKLAGDILATDSRSWFVMFWAGAT